MRRKPLRLQKAYDMFEFKGGNAGFIKLSVNGRDKKLINRTLIFNKRKEATHDR